MATYLLRMRLAQPCDNEMIVMKGLDETGVVGNSFSYSGYLVASAA
jgi:hypothetical protein